MKYYILPNASGVAITQGTYLEAHLFSGDDDPLLRGAENRIAGIIDLINSYSEENILGDEVFDDNVSDLAPVFNGTFLPDTFFYKLPCGFQIPAGWFRWLPSKSNEITKPDIYPDAESDEHEDRVHLRIAKRVLDEEMRKPFEEQDEELIEDCFSMIGEITGLKCLLSEEEIEQRVQEILRIASSLPNEI